MIGELVNSGSAPALEAIMRFAAQRQRFLANNLANIDTPNYLMQNASVGDFQQALGKAIDRRRESGDPGQAPLDISSDREISAANPSTGDFTLRPLGTYHNILFHDRNNRDLERLAQDQVENAAVFRIASDLLKGHHDLLRAAISERP
jgi:flagellar basal-body rod protein FlgB